MVGILFAFSGLLVFSFLSVAQSQFIPDDVWRFPEAIWAPAAYGGDWATEIYVHDIEGGAIIKAVYRYGTTMRGQFILADNTGKGPSIYKSSNILQDLQDHFDSGFDYYGQLGLLIIFNDAGKPLHVMGRNYHSNGYGKTMNAYPEDQDGDMGAKPSYPIKFQNIMKSSNFRTTVVLYNRYGAATVAECKVIGHRYLPSCGYIIFPPPPPSAWEESQLGSTFTVSFGTFEYKSFDPFALAGCPDTGYCAAPPFPGTKTYVYDCYLDVTVTSGSGPLIGYASVANNSNNDPASIIPVRKN